MASLLSIQYVSPSQATASTSRLDTNVHTTLVTDSKPSKFKVQFIPMDSAMNHYQQHHQLFNEKRITTGVSSVAAMKPRTPLNNNRLVYVDALVDANALVIESIWQLTSTKSNNNIDGDNNSVVPLRTFIQEVLKRSRTTYSTLQTALFYLFRSRPEIENHLSRMQNISSWEDAYVSCGRRMFLASLVIASKFVQDKTYRNSAWAKIAGLPVSEVNASERILLNIINYRLYINQSTFEKWHYLLHKHVEAKMLKKPANLQDFSCLPFAAPNNQQYEHYYYSNHLYADCNNVNTQNHSPNNVMKTPLSIHISSPHSPRSNTNSNLTIVLSPTSYLPPLPAVNSHNTHCECQKQLKRKRKRDTNCSTCYQRRHQQQFDYNIYLQQQQVSSVSLPSSINSSPLQTPKQISPIRMNNGTFVLNWSSPTGFDHNLHPRSIMNSGNNKKRKMSTIDTHPRSYILSNVRQQSKKNM